jgi:hypothetical protein
VEVTPPAQPAAAPRRVKTAIIDGQTVNLRTLGIGYRLCAIAIVYSLTTIIISIILLASGQQILGTILLWTGQIATTCMIAGGHERRAIGDGEVASPPRKLSAIQRVRTALLGCFCWIPLLGLIPALLFCSNAREVFTSQGVPLGIFGPAQSVIEILCEGLCHTCGYDISQQASNTCPECGGDVTSDKPSPSANAKPLSVTAEEFTSCASGCTDLVPLGLIIGLPAVSLLIVGGSTAHGFLTALWIAGVAWGLVASRQATHAQHLLAPQRSFASPAIGLTSLVNPALAALILLRLAAQLRRAARDTTAL